MRDEDGPHKCFRADLPHLVQWIGADTRWNTWENQRRTQTRTQPTSLPLVFDGRSAEIRTRDPLHPMQVRYQTAPRSDNGLVILGTDASGDFSRGGMILRTRRFREGLSA